MGSVTEKPEPVNGAAVSAFPSSLADSRDECVQHVSALFAQDDLILIRIIATTIIDGKKTSRVVHTEHFTQAQLLTVQTWQKLVNIAANNHACLFFGVCPRRAKGKDLAAHIRIARCLWADLDDCAPADALNRIEKADLPIPSIVINSGHGVHLYWLLSDPYMIDDAPPYDNVVKVNGQKTSLSPKAKRLQEINRLIASRIGGDATQDLSRLLRLAGSINRKNQRNGALPTPCNLVRCDPALKYSMADFVPLDGQPVQQHSAADALLPHLRRKLEQLLLSCATAIDRSRADFRLCCWAIRHNIPRELIDAQLSLIGKPAEQGKEYLDLTWHKAEMEVTQEQASNGHSTSNEKPAGNSKAEPDSTTSTSFNIGDLTIIPGTPRQTPTKVSVPLTLVRDGTDLDRFTISDAISNRKGAVKQIGRLVPNVSFSEIDARVGNILTGAADTLRVQRAKESGGMTIRQIVQEHVPPMYLLAHRTCRGAWSNKWRSEIVRQEFCENTPDWLMQLCTAAIDAPVSDDGLVNRVGLRQRIKCELEVLWATILENMPHDAAKRFKNSLVRIWTEPATFFREKHSEKIEIAHRATLIGRVREQVAKLPATTRKWVRVQRDFDAWFRVDEVFADAPSKNLLITRLAMRYTLASQMHVQMNGVDNQTDLVALASQHGLASVTAQTHRLSGGTHLFVLSDELTTEIMAEPDNKPVTEDDAPNCKKDGEITQEATQ